MSAKNGSVLLTCTVEEFAAIRSMTRERAIALRSRINQDIADEADRKWSGVLDKLENKLDTIETARVARDGAS